MLSIGHSMVLSNLLLFLALSFHFRKERLHVYIIVGECVNLVETHFSYSMRLGTKTRVMMLRGVSDRNS